ncbi:(2Fe-2S)-binding protein [Desulfitibacter alkalitolerans]|uniref:(2Fe-2S)-binding protein n=1 Tax=Desulfitibacter alkalitolerans TaxID=264641 RepID=UPI00047FD218|nr:(2Fe-2S)-binding protein [Desulfitibacter alkalitolerans]
MSGKTYLCRCEDVTLEDVHRLIDSGVQTFEEIKRHTRCTMGPCQGSTCRHVLAGEIARKKGLNIEEIDVPTYRAPIRPIKLGTIAGGEADA